MEILFEFILELVLEGSIEVSKNKKIPKYIRYPLILILFIFFLFVIGLIFLVGFLILKENILLGSCFIFIGIIFFLCCVVKFYKIYLKRKDELEMKKK